MVIFLSIVMFLGTFLFFLVLTSLIIFGFSYLITSAVLSIQDFLEKSFPKKQISKIYALVIFIISTYASSIILNPMLSLAISEIEKMFSK